MMGCFVPLAMLLSQVSVIYMATIFPLFNSSVFPWSLTSIYSYIPATLILLGRAGACWMPLLSYLA
jgi:hypothetical protein